MSGFFNLVNWLTCTTRGLSTALGGVSLAAHEYFPLSLKIGGMSGSKVPSHKFYVIPDS